MGCRPIDRPVSSAPFSPVPADASALEALFQFAGSPRKMRAGSRRMLETTAPACSASRARGQEVEPAPVLRARAEEEGTPLAETEDADPAAVLEREAPVLHRDSHERAIHHRLHERRVELQDVAEALRAVSRRDQPGVDRRALDERYWLLGPDRGHGEPPKALDPQGARLGHEAAPRAEGREVGVLAHRLPVGTGSSSVTRKRWTSPFMTCSSTSSFAGRSAVGTRMRAP